MDTAVRERPDVCLLGLDPAGQRLRVVSEIVSRPVGRRDPADEPARRGGVHGRSARGRERLPDAEPRPGAPAARRPGCSARRAGGAAPVRVAAARRAEDTRAQALGRPRRTRAGSRSRRANGRSSNCCCGRRPRRRSQPSSASRRSPCVVTSAPSSTSSESRRAPRSSRCSRQRPARPFRRSPPRI